MVCVDNFSAVSWERLENLLQMFGWQSDSSTGKDLQWSGHGLIEGLSRRYATILKVAGSIPMTLIFCSVHIFLPAAPWLRGLLSSNRNQYQKISGSKARPACGADKIAAMCGLIIWTILSTRRLTVLRSQRPVTEIGLLSLCCIQCVLCVLYCLCSFVCCVLSERGVLFCVICVFLCVVS
jgi:hypothetical protein